MGVLVATFKENEHRTSWVSWRYGRLNKTALVNFDWRLTGFCKGEKYTTVVLIAVLQHYIMLLIAVLQHYMIISIISIIVGCGNPGGGEGDGINGTFDMPISYH